MTHPNMIEEVVKKADRLSTDAQQAESWRMFVHLLGTLNKPPWDQIRGRSMELVDILTVLDAAIDLGQSQ